MVTFKGGETSVSFLFTMFINGDQLERKGADLFLLDPLFEGLHPPGKQTGSQENC